MNVDSLEFGQDVAPGMIDGLPRVAGLNITRGHRSARLRTKRGTQAVTVIPAHGRQNPETLVNLAQQIKKTTALPMVVGAFISRTLRTRLEDADVSYLDGGGHIHIVGDLVFVHVDKGLAAPSSIADGLGITGVRLVQVILSNGDQMWSVAELAKAGDASAGLAHKVLRILENNDLVIPLGKGPAKRRRVRDSGLLLNWLAEEKAGLGNGIRKSFTLYARSSSDLCRRVADLFSKSEVDYAITGVAAADLLKAGPTAVPRTLIRINPKVRLEDAAAILGAEPADRGANLLLRKDAGLLGTTGTIDHDGVRLASPVRIYLDLLSESRGEDLANHFRERALGF